MHKSTFGKAGNLPAWRYYAQFFWSNAGTIGLSQLVSFGQALLVVAIPLLAGYAIDTVIPAADVSRLMLVGGAIFLLYLSHTGIALWVRFMVLRITETAIQNFRSELLAQLYRVSRHHYSGTDASHTHTAILHYTDILNRVTSQCISRVAPALIICAALCSALLFLNWRLFIMLTVAGLVMAGISRVLGNIVRERVKHSARAYERFHKSALFFLQMMDLTRMQAAEDFEMSRQNKNMDALRRSRESMARIYAVHHSVKALIINSLTIIILVAGGAAVIDRAMTPGELLTFYVATNLLKIYLDTILSVIPELIEANEYLAVLFQLATRGESRPYTGQQTPGFKEHIQLEAVDFGYNGPPLLRNLSLTITPHSRTAIVGPTGVGKTTLVYLILGFYRPHAGRLLIDGDPYDVLDIVQLRRLIGVVVQDPMIFEGTLLENISYGCPDATREQIEQAARMATAHTFIEQLPLGYETPVGERGMTLSGGQRQRLAIARALLRQPRLLILDEPSNHLDYATVQQILNNIADLDPRPALLIISHDKRLARQAERIFVLRDGCLTPAQSPDPEQEPLHEPG